MPMDPSTITIKFPSTSRVALFIPNNESVLRTFKTALASTVIRVDESRPDNNEYVDIIFQTSWLDFEEGPIATRISLSTLHMPLKPSESNNSVYYPGLVSISSPSSLFDLPTVDIDGALRFGETAPVSVRLSRLREPWSFEMMCNHLKNGFASQFAPDQVPEAASCQMTCYKALLDAPWWRALTSGAEGALLEVLWWRDLTSGAEGALLEVLWWRDLTSGWRALTSGAEGALLEVLWWRDLTSGWRDLTSGWRALTSGAEGALLEVLWRRVLTSGWRALTSGAEGALLEVLWWRDLTSGWRDLTSGWRDLTSGWRALTSGAEGALLEVLWRRVLTSGWRALTSGAEGALLEVLWWRDLTSGWRDLTSGWRALTSGAEGVSAAGGFVAAGPNVGLAGPNVGLAGPNVGRGGGAAGAPGPGGPPPPPPVGQPIPDQVIPPVVDLSHCLDMESVYDTIKPVADQYWEDRSRMTWGNMRLSSSVTIPVAFAIVWLWTIHRSQLTLNSALVQRIIGTIKPLDAADHHLRDERFLSASGLNRKLEPDSLCRLMIYQYFDTLHWVKKDAQLVGMAMAIVHPIIRKKYHDAWLAHVDQQARSGETALFKADVVQMLVFDCHALCQLISVRRRVVLQGVSTALRSFLAPAQHPKRDGRIFDLDHIHVQASRCRKHFERVIAGDATWHPLDV
ncbi:hypothetical protein LXA43DRAFT_1097695 [Ganoderma leucocontextum]|nr:hypothetical protein LXA43DRAFT_1097695 [Ganoderma leucocontextum]